MPKPSFVIQVSLYCVALIAVANCTGCSTPQAAVPQQLAVVEAPKKETAQEQYARAQAFAKAKKERQAQELKEKKQREIEARAERKRQEVAARVAREQQRQERIKAERAEYADNVKEHLGNITDGMGKFSELCTEAGQTPALLFDNDFVIRYATSLALVRVGADGLRKYNAPDSMASIHSDIIDMCRDLDRFTDNAAESVDHVRSGNVDTGTYKMRRAVQYLNNSQERAIAIRERLESLKSY